MHDRFATYYNWPTKWNSLNTLSKKRYSQKLHQWYENLQTWKDSNESFTAMKKEGQIATLQSMAIWYNKEKALNGLRYTGDNGPKVPEIQVTPSTLIPFRYNSVLCSACLLV